MLVVRREELFKPTFLHEIIIKLPDFRLDVMNSFD